MCLVLFVVITILVSSELLSCLLEMGVEYYLVVCTREGLLCGKGTEPPRGRGRLSGARESQLFFGYITTKMFSKIHLDITTTTTTDRNYIIRMY